MDDARREGLKDGIVEGRKQGVAMERTRIRPIEWAKLRAMVVTWSLIGAFLGCCIALAIAVQIAHV